VELLADVAKLFSSRKKFGLDLFGHVPSVFLVIRPRFCYHISLHALKFTSEIL